ncbi:MAG: PadR family transcriptional regulator, partial [Bradyrhizobium canariense]
RLHALDSIGLEPMRTDLMARLEHHRDRHENYERILKKRFPEGAASGVLELGNLLLLQLGARHEQMVADFCEEALEALSAMSASGTVVPLEDGKREGKG